MPALLDAAPAGLSPRSEPRTPARHPAPPAGRSAALDAFRGLTIAGMIIVNTPGNRAAYPLLEHADWNGCTLADLVFPFFLFAVGASLVLSLSRRVHHESGGRLWLGILKRAAVIFAFGLLLNAIPNWRPETFRVAGVLQRISVCYLFGAALFLGLRPEAGGRAPRGLIAAAAFLLAIYALALRWLPVPGVGAGVLTPEGSLSSWLDRLVMGKHTYHQGPFDPEGVLGTLGACATTVIGMLAGYELRSPRPAIRKAVSLAAGGILLISAGQAWDRWLPVNKALWTGSYALYTAGAAAVVLAACLWAIEVRGRRAWSEPFEALGVNSLAAYVLPLLLLKFLVLYKVPGADGAPIQLRLRLCDLLFGRLSAPDASLAFALSYLLLWTGVFWSLRRRGWVFKA